MKENTTCEWEDGGKIVKIILTEIFLSMHKTWYLKVLFLQFSSVNSWKWLITYVNQDITSSKKYWEASVHGSLELCREIMPGLNHNCNFTCERVHIGSSNVGWLWQHLRKKMALLFKEKIFYVNRQLNLGLLVYYKKWEN